MNAGDRARVVFAALFAAAALALVAGAVALVATTPGDADLAPEMYLLGGLFLVGLGACPALAAAVEIHRGPPAAWVAVALLGLALGAAGATAFAQDPHAGTGAVTAVLVVAGARAVERLVRGREPYRLDQPR